MGKKNLPDHSSITRTVYGVVRNELKLIYIIEFLSDRHIKKIESDNLILLEIGLFLLLLSESYPNHAIVNEIVALAKERSKPFINAILRKASKNIQNIETHLKNITDLSIKYSLSPVVIANLRLISDNLIEDLDYLNTEPVFHIKVNTKTNDKENIKKILLENRINFQEHEKFNSLEINKSEEPIVSLQEKRDIYFQNLASQMISLIALKYGQQTILDCCAAPGGKSITLALLAEKLNIYANDIKFSRIKLMKNFLPAFRLSNIKMTVSDIKRSCFSDAFDFIIVDAPCTSAGTIRKNPDLKLKIDPQRVKKNQLNQYEILSSVIRNFSNSYILYAVCSFIEEETEKIIEKIFAVQKSAAEKNFSLKVINISSILDEYEFNYKRTKWGFYLRPDSHLNNDLFYLSLIKKEKVR